MNDEELAAAENLARAVLDPASYWEERCARAESAYRDVWVWWEQALRKIDQLEREVADLRAMKP